MIKLFNECVVYIYKTINPQHSVKRVLKLNLSNTHEYTSWFHSAIFGAWKSFVESEKQKRGTVAETLINTETSTKKQKK